MRLVCPNCGAQYEVPAEAIPASGRDVQCSACAHTWFEAGASETSGEADAWAGPAGSVPRVEDDDEEADDLAEAAWQDAPDVGAPEAVAGVPRPPRSTVTPEVAEILRAEAEREARARDGERVVGLDGARGGPRGGARASPPSDPDRERAEEARRRMARLRGEPAGAAPAPQAPTQAPTFVAPPAAIPQALPTVPVATVVASFPPAGVAVAEAPPVAPAEPPREAPPARRDRLPDIEEISSSLRGTPPADLAPSPPGRAPRPRGGFRLGFGGVLALAAALALAYAYGPRVAAAWPASGAVLGPYVAAIDEGRLWLDLRLQGLLRAVDEPAAEGVAREAAGATDATGATGVGPSTPSLPEAPGPDAPPAVLPEDPPAPAPGREGTTTLTVPVTEPAPEPAPTATPAPAVD